MSSPNSPVTSTAYLQDLLKAKQLEINSLLELTQAINNNKSAKELFDIYRFTLGALYKINTLLVLYKNEAWEIIYKHGVEDKEIKNLYVNQKWANINDITPAIEINQNIPEKLKWIVPVKHKNQFLAFILLSDFEEGYTTDSKSDEFVKTITNIIIVAIENKRLFNKQIEQTKLQHEMELASKVQQMLVPHQLPKITGVDVATFYKPHAQVGGDYFDVFKLNSNHYLFCVADVSGKNVSAALLMANFQASLRASAEIGRNLKQLATHLNKRIFELTEGDRFVTMLLAIYNKSTNKLKYVNAGHPPLLHIRGNKVEQHTKGCMMLGANPILPKLEKGEFDLKKGDVLAIYTDGFSDMQNEDGEIFPIEEKIALAAQKNNTAQTIMDWLINESENFENIQSRLDDRTAMIIKINQ